MSKYDASAERWLPEDYIVAPQVKTVLTPYTIVRWWPVPPGSRSDTPEELKSAIFDVDEYEALMEFQELLVLSNTKFETEVLQPQ